jgi:hypothetical protein
VLYDGTDSPTVSVEFDIGKVGTFVLGVSLLGGPDLMLASAPAVWDAVPGDVIRSISTRRGRTREDQAMQPGTATIVLDNLDGDFDPDNPASSYMWAGYSLLTRGLGVRVRATWSATDYSLFTGTIEDVVPDQSLDPVATITCVDGLGWLGSQPLDAIASSFSGDTSSARAARILDTVGWSASARSLTGTRQMQPTTYNATALALVEQCAAAEGGRIYADRDGTLALLPYESTFTTTQRLTLSDTRLADTVEYDTLKTSPGGSYMANDVTLTMTTGSTVTVTNAESVTRFGSYPKNVTAPLLNTGEATAVAQSIADRFAFPQARVDHVEFDALNYGTLWPSIVQADLAERVSVIRNMVDGRSRTYGCVIESVNHDLGTAGWRVSMDLSPGASSVYFIVNSSLLGGTDSLYY